jgi:Domain of unknown function (DUF4440)
MRLRMASAIVAVGLASPVTVPAQPDTSHIEANDAHFKQLTLQVQGAIQRKDTAALDKLFAKDFSFSMPVSGKVPQVMNRAEFLKLGSLYTLESFHITNLATRVWGGMAVVRFQSYRQAQLGSVDRSGEFVVVDTWVKDGDAWHLSMRLLARPDPGVAAAK